MKRIAIKMVLQAPTLIAAAPPTSNLTETLLFIPGNTVRGVLARQYLDSQGKPSDPAFQQLFLAGQVRFSCAYAAGAQPLPLSARSCKYDSGFRVDGGHGMLDLLLAGAEEQNCHYEDCRAPIDYAQGFWDPQQGRRVAVHTRLITRTAIDPRRGTASTGQLFSQRVIEEGQTFHASIEAPETAAQVLERLVQRSYTARLGRGASRGQGWVEVSRTEEAVPAWGTATERFQRFCDRTGKVQLVVTLLSDSLFQDAYLRDKTAPALADLLPLGINQADWQETPTKAFMDTRIIFGFDGEPLRLPRQPRLAVAAGSTFLYTAKEGVTQPSLPAGSGCAWIGMQNSEGYGQAIVWHPFHLAPEGGVRAASFTA